MNTQTRTRTHAGTHTGDHHAPDCNEVQSEEEGHGDQNASGRDGKLVLVPGQDVQREVVLREEGAFCV